MAEGRISGVVQQPGAGGYGGRAAAERRILLEILRQVGRGVLRDHSGKIPGNGGHLHRVCQTGADKIALVQRKYLRFVLQPPKRLTGDDGQKIVVKRVYVKLLELLRLFFLRLLPFGADELLPLHPISSASLFSCCWSIAFLTQSILRYCRAYVNKSCSLSSHTAMRTDPTRLPHCSRSHLAVWSHRASYGRCPQPRAPAPKAPVRCFPPQNTPY